MWELNSYKQDLNYYCKTFPSSSKYQLYFWALNRTLTLSFPCQKFYETRTTKPRCLAFQDVNFSWRCLAPCYFNETAIVMPAKLIGDTLYFKVTDIISAKVQKNCILCPFFGQRTVSFKQNIYTTKRMPVNVRQFFCLQHEMKTVTKVMEIFTCYSTAVKFSANIYTLFSALLFL